MITRIIIEMTPDEDGIDQGYEIVPSESRTQWDIHDHHEGASYWFASEYSIYEAVTVALDEALVTSEPDHKLL